MGGSGAPAGRSLIQTGPAAAAAGRAVGAALLVRLLRSVPLLGADAAAAALTQTPHQALHRLRCVTARGRCCHLAAWALTTKGVHLTRQVAAHRAAPAVVLRRSARAGRAAAASGAAGSHMWYSRLAAQPHRQITRRLLDAVSAAAVPGPVLRRHARGGGSMADAVARNVRSPGALLAYLGRQPDICLRAAVAVAAPAAVVEALAKEPDPSVRAAAARSPRISSATLGRFALDPCPQAEAAAASNPAAPPSALAAFAAFVDFFPVGWFAAANPACPPGALAALCVASDSARRAVAAANPACPPEAVAVCCEDPDASVRAAAAANPACPPEGVAVCCEDPDASVRAAVVPNPRLSASALRRLDRDVSPQVRSALRRRRATLGAQDGGRR